MALPPVLHIPPAKAEGSGLPVATIIGTAVVVAALIYMFVKL
jgi:hypothetical protein